MTYETYRRFALAAFFAALLFSWLCGFCAGVLCHTRWAQADAPTARERQVERYEGMGR